MQGKCSGVTSAKRNVGKRRWIGTGSERVWMIIETALWDSDKVITAKLWYREDFQTLKFDVAPAYRRTRRYLCE